jgi:hypothetical protein
LNTKHKILIQPKLFAENKGDSAYWKDFNWETASAAGMKQVGLPLVASTILLKPKCTGLSTTW